MRPYSLPFLLLVLLTTNTVRSQEREEVTNESGSVSPRIKEIYFVLKSDKSVKDGPYQQFWNDKLILTGFYNNGQKDSVWESYSTWHILLARKWYAQGKMTGKWEFFDLGRALAYSYDFVTGKTTYPENSKQGKALQRDTTTYFYQTSSGDWVRGKLDKDPLPLFGPAEWLNYLNNSFRYPDEAVDKEQQGTVLISMVVDENGQVSNYAVSQKAAPSLDQEALRVVSSYERLYIPGEKDGKKVKTLFLQPIIFKMQK